MQLELTADEGAILEEILTRALHELRVEVRRTGTPAYHDELEQQEQRLESLLTRLRDQLAA